MERNRWPVVAGAVVILASRLLTMPHTFWEFDEMLFASAVKNFEPLVQHPHQPGYPLYVGLAKAFAFLFGDAFRGMVALSVIACVVGYVFLARYAGALPALIFYFTPGALVHLTLPLSDSAAILFLAIAFATMRSDRLVVFALACSAAIGCRPQLAIPLLPVFFFILIRERKFAAPIAAFTALSLAWFVPLVVACGGWDGFVRWQLHQASYVAAHDATMSRGAAAMRSLIAWFVIHPFGPKWLAAPLLLLAIGGFVVMVRRRQFAPLVFGALHLALALLVMEPADSVRYSLPHVMIICIAIGASLSVIRDWRVTAGITAVIAIASIAFTWPLLRARTTTPSPTFAAAQYANRTFAPDTVIAYDLSVRPHAEYLMSRFRSMPLDRALTEFYDRPDVPVVEFVNGGSLSPEAKVFSWPHSEAYTILTRDLYEQVTLDPVRPAERYLPVAGVYALERMTNGEEWRWLAREARIRLPQAHGARLTLGVMLPHDAPWPDNTVHIFVDGVEAASVVANKNHASGITVPVPAGRVEITLRSDHSFRPADVLQNQDPRELAVQLVSLVDARP